MDARLKQFLLIALQSNQDGEILAALYKARSHLSKSGSDAHRLLEPLSTTSSPPPDARVGILVERLNRLEQQLLIRMMELNQARQENDTLRQQVMLARMTNSPPSNPYQGERRGATSDWQQQAEQLLLTCHRLTRKEADFLETMSRWKGQPTDKQRLWLAALWDKYG